MDKKLKLAVIALCCAPVAMAQQADSLATGIQDEQAFTFTEAQLGEDDNMSQNVTITGSNSNVYASQVGYLFSPVRFRYRAFNQKYNDIYINGVQMNDMESGQFRYSLVGGLNRQTNNSRENSLPFEDNNFAMAAMGGSTNYNFRPSNFATGHYVAVSGANRSYKLRGMYSYNTGVTEKGWAFSGALTYRWADQGYAEGTFYNSLSYFLGVEKFINDQHHISLVTWGNPTERASQGAATDEMYWLANDRYYNPYWGYQNGHKRNSRVINDFAPTALFTWDWFISEKAKLVTALTGRYSMYKSTKLNYNNTDNPQPNYWKNLPSSYYDVWTDYQDGNANQSEQGLSDWLRARTLMSGYKADRQINFDRLYYANRQAAMQGADAMYYIQAKNINNLNLALASTLTLDVTKNSRLNLGVQLATNKGMHYQTMEDLLGADQFHNINTYALGTYNALANEVQYDANNPNAVVREGDKFGYNYNLLVDRATLWGTYTANVGNTRAFVSGRVSGVEMQRDGKMRNGMFLDNSYGKSKTARFLDGGGKVGATVNLGHGHALTGGFGVELRAPQAQAAFVSPEMNNDFVVDLKNEKNYSAELGYQLRTPWLKANISAFGAIITDATEWQNFYFDDINSFSYVSMTGISKEYYGVEWGLNFKLASFLDLKTLGNISEARNTNNAQVWYMSSTKGVFNEANNGNPELVYNKNMRESGTPLTAISVMLSYHNNGWFIDLNGNWYDRIYLSYSPSYRYMSTLTTRQSIDGDVFDANGNVREDAVAQAKGHGGFMLDASIGKMMYLHHGRSLRINLSLTNLLNNQKIVTGGYEQSRADYTSSGNERAYKFSRNPMKYYAYGINGMLNIAYLF